MKKALGLLLISAVMLLATSPAQARSFDAFKDIKIFDNILVYVDVDGDGLDPFELREQAVEAFKEDITGMILNDDAWVDNYPAEGYTVENVGYIMIKVMSIRTEGGLNVYHLNFEFGIPPRQVYWDTATMGVAPTGLDFKKEVKEDIDEVMKTFSEAFFKARGQ